MDGLGEASENKTPHKFSIGGAETPLSDDSEDSFKIPSAQSTAPTSPMTLTDTTNDCAEEFDLFTGRTPSVSSSGSPKKSAKRSVGGFFPMPKLVGRTIPLAEKLGYNIPTSPKKEVGSGNEVVHIPESHLSGKIRMHIPDPVISSSTTRTRSVSKEVISSSTTRTRGVSKEVIRSTPNRPSVSSTDLTEYTYTDNTPSVSSAVSDPGRVMRSGIFPMPTLVRRTIPLADKLGYAVHSSPKKETPNGNQFVHIPQAPGRTRIYIPDPVSKPKKKKKKKKRKKKYPTRERLEQFRRKSEPIRRRNNNDSTTDELPVSHKQGPIEIGTNNDYR